MDKQQYKDMIAEQLDEISELKTKLVNKAKQLLRLEMENAELKDMVLDNGGDYTSIDIDKQLELFDDNQLSIFESPDGGNTVYKRKFGDYTNRQEVKDSRDISND